MDSFQATFSFTIRVLTVAIILLGLIGNGITFIVFSRKTFLKNSISLFCRALAISDSFTLYMAVVYFYLILYNYSISSYSDTMCKLNFYISYALGSIPGWILIAFSIDKVLSLKKISTNRMKKPLKHYMIIFFIVLFNLLLYIEIPIYMKLVPIRSGWTCNPSYLDFGVALNDIYIIESSFLPFVIMFVSSLYTVKLLRDSRRNVELGVTQAEKRRRRDKRYAITSIAFNVLFIVLRMPYLLTLAIGANSFDYYVRQVASFMFFLNYVVSFYVHYVSNSIFRKEFLIMIRVRKETADSGATNPNNTNHT